MSLRLAIIALPVCLLALPFALRPAQRPDPTQQVVVITPHGEAIRAEFGAAFASWAKRELGLEAGIDWRTPGGTGDIVRYLDDRYGEAFTARFKRTSRSFNDAKSTGTDRADFLASEIGIGIDVFFGGGEFPHRQQAAKGYLVDAGLQREHPAWFAEAIVPGELSGERMYDPQGRYYGACISAFGIAVHRDRLAALVPPGPIESWRDLADGRLCGAVIVADPSRSGAIATACERVLQSELAAAAVDPDHPTPAELEAGWQAGWDVLRRIAANAAWVSDGASKAVRAVARGEVAAGMCIDFHARAESEWTQLASGAPRLDFVMPRAGTSLSADPIALLRGAPHRSLAVAFMRFVLSPEGQRLWNYKVGEPGGPVRYALRRLPIRRDLYSAEHRPHMSDPEVDPFADAARFTYRGRLTGPLFSLIAPLAKGAIFDPREELVAAWRAILAAGGPNRVPQAMAAFSHLGVTYAEAAPMLARIQADPLVRLEQTRRWAEAARQRYSESRRLAEEGR
jgi:iron(III) transport system substrate-binding protein